MDGSKSFEPNVGGKMKWHFSSYKHIYKKSRLEKLIGVSLVEKSYKVIISVENINFYFNESVFQNYTYKFCDKRSTDKSIYFFSQQIS